MGSLLKGLSVLEAFTAEQPELSVSEAAAAAQLDPGTAYRMLTTLAEAGYLARDPATRRFRLTLKVLDLGFAAIARRDLRDTARPILRSLVGETSEAASLGVLDGADILYVERVRAGLTRLGVDIRVGTTIPAATSAIGNALLAFLDKAEVARILALPPRPGALPMVPVDPAALARRLAAARRDGFVLNESPFTPGLRLLAVPVLDADRQPIAVVSVAAPSSRASAAEFRSNLLRPVMAAAAEIGRALAAGGATLAVVAPATQPRPGRRKAAA
ncbi:IclR family transcriptional regulator [Roseomonas sp. AR75]|uniref:IclR family transcriptional regulator n=1 Tax=Roseomonas sp. AR75 TaxID=2562311 RepID=UPI001F0DC362|nr:IclR family transcriptional regulator [Roseomonas sp. AR75]